MRDGIHRVAGKVPDMPEQEVILTRMLMIGGDLVTARLTEVLRPHGLTESDFRTLVVLFSSDHGSAHPSELCQFATQKPTNMTRIADGLVARQLATRSHSEADRRRILIRISPQGRRFVSKLLPELFPRMRSLFSILSKTEKKQLDRILGKLLQHMSDKAETEKDAS
ncbi:MAG: MarR family transcriptional regulator [Rhodanobacteraceae bacterium]